MKRDRGCSKWETSFQTRLRRKCGQYIGRECTIIYEAYSLFDRFKHLVTELSKRASYFCSEASAVNEEEERALSSEFFQLYQDFKNRIATCASPFLASSYADEVEKVMRRCTGNTLPNMVSNTVFAALFDKEKRKTETPSYELNDAIK